MKRVLPLSIVLAFPPLTPAQEKGEFRVTIEREAETDTCTRGSMLVNGEYLCRTIELPWKENQKNVSSIPPGTYKGHLRYDKPDQWRIQLDDVPGGRTGVQIHVGNYTSEIQGCILVGTALAADGCSIAGGTSKPAYSALRKKFYGTDEPNSCPDLKVVVEVVAPPGALGTWKSQATPSGDPEGRFTLVVEKDRVVWVERNKSGTELRRELKVDATKASFVLERANDDEVLRFLDFGDKSRAELRGRNLHPSKLSVTVGKGELTCEWTGLKVTKNKKAEVESVTYPTKQFVFKKVSLEGKKGG